jgi:hypothetical protein
MTSKIKEENNQSIRTTLLIPFYLKEKTGNEFLNKGFEIDDILNKYFKDKKKSSSFFKICTISADGLKIAIVKALLKKLSLTLETSSARKIDFFKNSSLKDEKYLSSIESFYLTADNLVHRDVSFIEKIIFDRLGSFKFRYSENENENNNPFYIDFLISDIKLIFNRSATCNGIGYGFISINLDWKTDKDIIETSKLIAKSQKLLRFFGSGIGLFNCILENDILFDSKTINASGYDFFNSKLQNKKRANLYSKKDDPALNELECNESTIDIVIDKLTEDVVESKEDYKAIKSLIEKSAKLTEKNKTSITFKDIVEEILNIFIDVDQIGNSEKNYKKYIDFSFSGENNLSVKPSYLYLCKFQDNIVDKEFDTLPFDVLRLPPKNSSKINNSENSFKPVIVDDRIKFYLQSEGAFIVEGSEMNFKEYSNKYFLSFLFAINQRFLFQYFQQKITELNLDKDNYYEPQELRRLNANMIKAEFNQVFSSISNYHEIDFFYEKLREILNIKVLTEEYLASINGLERIVSIAEARERSELEKKHTEENQRMREIKIQRENKEKEERAVEKAEQIRIREEEKAEQIRIRAEEKAEQIRIREEEKAEQIRIREEEKAEQLSIREKEKAEQLSIREKEKAEREEINKKQSDRLNAILLVLTIAQVWSGIYETVFDAEKPKIIYWINVVFSLSVILGLLGYFLIEYSNKNKKIK